MRTSPSRRSIFESGEDQLKTLRISGVFRTGEPEELLRAISSYFALRTQREENGDYVLTAAA